MYAAVFLVTVLVYTVILLLQKAYPFGDKSFLTYDAYVQYKNMFHMLFEWISGGSKGSFIWSMGMGIDAVQELLYYCLSPFNIIVLMLGESRLELSMVLLIIIKSACLPVTALYFFRHTNKKKYREWVQPDSCNVHRAGMQYGIWTVRVCPCIWT